MRAIYGLGALIGVGIAAPATVYVFGSPSSKRETGWIDAGSIGAIAQDVPVELPVFRIHRDGWKITTEQDSVWVVKSDSSLTAFSRDALTSAAHTTGIPPSDSLCARATDRCSPLPARLYQDLHRVH